MTLFTISSITTASEALFDASSSSEVQRQSDTYLRAFQSSHACVLELYRGLILGGSRTAAFVAAQALLIVVRSLSDQQSFEATSVLDLSRSPAVYSETRQRLHLVFAASLVRSSDTVVRGILTALLPKQVSLGDAETVSIVNAINDEFPVNPFPSSRTFREFLPRVLRLLSSPKADGLRVKGWLRLGVGAEILSEALSQEILEGCQIEAVVEILEYSENSFKLFNMIRRAEGAQMMACTKAEEILLRGVFASREMEKIGHVLSESFMHLLVFESMGEISSLPPLIEEVARFLDSPEGCMAFAALWENLRNVVREVKDLQSAWLQSAVRGILERLGESALSGAFKFEQESGIGGEVVVELYLLGYELGKGEAVLDYCIAKGRQALESPRLISGWLRAVRETIELLAGEELTQESRLWQLLEIVTSVGPEAGEEALKVAVSLAESSAIVVGQKEKESKEMLEWLFRVGPIGARALLELVTFCEYKDELKVMIPFLVSAISQGCQEEYLASIVAILRDDKNSLDGNVLELVKKIACPNDLVTFSRRLLAICWAVTGRDGRDNSLDISLNALGDLLTGLYFFPNLKTILQVITNVKRGEEIRLDRLISENPITDIFKCLRLIIRTCYGSQELRKTILQLAISSDHLTGLLLVADLCKYAPEPNIISHACNLALANPKVPELCHFFTLMAEMPAEFRAFLPFVITQLQFRTESESLKPIINFITKLLARNLLSDRHSIVEVCIHRFHAWPRTLVPKISPILEILIAGQDFISPTAFQYIGQERRLLVASALSKLTGPRLKLFLIALHNYANKLEIIEAGLDVYLQVAADLPRGGFVPID